MDCYAKMKELGISIPSSPGAGGIYVPMVKIGEKVYVTSGVGCKKDGKYLYMGQAGKDFTIEQAQEAARQCILNLLSIIQNQIGDLNNITQIIKLLGFVSSTDNFGEQPKVMDAASQLLIEVFGTKVGTSARSAIGTNNLPGNQAVEIEMMFEVK